ncbi:hypothetical protein [Treponema primitia]|uniref:hypothetical protein n=1 Tax=Treponema primitia TaxID=88058 RepID=UPI0018E16E38|nr:hypothetical protein [Treponema primitia]
MPGIFKTGITIKCFYPGQSSRLILKIHCPKGPVVFFTPETEEKQVLFIPYRVVAVTAFRDKTGKNFAKAGNFKPFAFKIKGKYSPGLFVIKGTELFKGVNPGKFFRLKMDVPGFKVVGNIVNVFEVV